MRRRCFHLLPFHVPRKFPRSHFYQAVDYMTAMGKQREARQHWQRAAKLILLKSDVMTVSRALELALFIDAKLAVSKVQ